MQSFCLVFIHSLCVYVWSFLLFMMSIVIKRRYCCMNAWMSVIFVTQDMWNFAHISEPKYQNKSSTLKRSQRRGFLFLGTMHKKQLKHIRKQVPSFYCCVLYKEVNCCLCMSTERPWNGYDTRVCSDLIWYALCTKHNLECERNNSDNNSNNDIEMCT